jgi:hypothetical protein
MVAECRLLQRAVCRTSREYFDRPITQGTEVMEERLSVICDKYFAIDAQPLARGCGSPWSAQRQRRRLMCDVPSPVGWCKSHVMGPRHISVVVFDVDIESGDGREPTDIMRLVFGQTPAIHLRARSPLIYQSGNFQQSAEEPGIWTGRLDRIRTSRASFVERDLDGSFRFIDRNEATSSAQATTLYAYDESSAVLLYRDTGELPHTRLASYVQGAVAVAREQGARFNCEVRPRRVERSLSDWIRQFTTIDRVTVRYSHSRSPGNRAVDRVIEALNASVVTETVVAPEDGHLNKSELLNQQHPIGLALDHIEQSAKNGGARLYGHVGGERIKVDTRSPVERHMLEVEETVASMRGTLARALAGLFLRGRR